jgi:hypothetical protein
MKTKIGSSTATAPSNTQGGTPAQNFAYLFRSVLEKGWFISRYARVAGCFFKWNSEAQDSK